MNRSLTITLLFLSVISVGVATDLSAALNAKPSSIILTGKKAMTDTCDTLSRALHIPIITSMDVPETAMVSIEEPHQSIRALLNDVATQADCWWQANDGFIAIYRNRLFVFSLNAAVADKDKWQRIETALHAAVPEGCRVGVFPSAGLASASLSPSEHARFVAAITPFGAKEKDSLPR